MTEAEKQVWRMVYSNAVVSEGLVTRSMHNYAVGAADDAILFLREDCQNSYNSMTIAALEDNE